jgi:hypothetical protein
VHSLPFSNSVLDWYETRVAVFGDPRIAKSETDNDVRCPIHADQRPSLGVDLRQNGRGPQIVVRCRSANCPVAKILEAVGLTFADLYFEKKAVATGETAPMNGSSGDGGITVAEYAEAKRLPEEFLRGDGVQLEDTTWGNRPAILIPYPDPNGELVANRFRIALDQEEDRFRWQKGSKSMLYGLHTLEDARERGFCLLCEGESDCHTAWHRGLPALAVPGAGNWKQQWASYFEGIDTILVLVEPDGAGEGLWEKNSATPALAGRLKKLELS